MVKQQQIPSPYDNLDLQQVPYTSHSLELNETKTTVYNILTYSKILEEAGYKNIPTDIVEMLVFGQTPEEFTYLLSISSFSEIFPNFEFDIDQKIINMNLLFGKNGVIKNKEELHSLFYKKGINRWGQDFVLGLNPRISTLIVAKHLKKFFGEEFYNIKTIGDLKEFIYFFKNNPRLYKIISWDNEDIKREFYNSDMEHEFLEKFYGKEKEYKFFNDMESYPIDIIEQLYYKNKQSNFYNKKETLLEDYKKINSLKPVDINNIKNKDDLDKIISGSLIPKDGWNFYVDKF